MNKENLRVSLTKIPGRTVIYDYGPLDRDLKALIRGDLNLILCIDFRSNGQGAKGELGRRSGSPEPCSAAALHRSRLNSTFPGSNRPAPGAGVIYAEHVVHMRPLRASGRARAAGSTAAAGLCGGARRRATFWDLKRALRTTS